MDRSDTVEMNLQIPSDTVEVQNSQINRGLQLPSFFSSGLASAISTFFIGLLSGSAGGLLLGATAVVLLQSVELLADNKLLMNHLEKYIVDYPGILLRTSNDHVLNNYVSMLVEGYDVFSSTLSLSVGIFVGLSTYTLVIKKHSEAAMGKALLLAGPVCLMCVTLTGYILGSALQRFLSITFYPFLSIVCISFWFVISIYALMLLPLLCPRAYLCRQIPPFLNWLLTPIVIFTVFVIRILVTSKLTLIVPLIPTICSVIQQKSIYSVRLIIAPVPLMLIITDVFNFAGQPIVVLQSPANASSAVPEGMFVGVLTSQMLTAAIGMSLFVSWHTGGAGKIYGSAAGSGAAASGAMKLALPVLGPGPTIGALTGVAGAVGVSLSAALAITRNYGQAVDRYGLVGTLGVTLGAAAGAGLSSFAHSGLSGMFMGLCAATIPAGLHLELLFLFLWQKFRLYLGIAITPIVLAWLYFTGTNYFAVIFVNFIGFVLFHTGCYVFYKGYRLLLYVIHKDE